MNRHIQTAASCRPPRCGARRLAVVLLAVAAFVPTAFSETTSPTPPLPDVGASVLRVFGALLLVLALFLGGVWLFRNSQRFLGHPNGGSKLNVIEVRSIGNRQALYVIAYGRQRLLLGSSPAGVSLVSPLPEAPEEEELRPEVPSFGETLQRVLRRK